MAAYANDYSQYVTTKEEYDMQHYEGASNLFGPFTLHAYQQEFRKLSIALRTGKQVGPGPWPTKSGAIVYDLSATVYCI
jgi:neutral ceramidase